MRPLHPIIALFFLATVPQTMQAQTIPKLDTIQADGYLSIISPGYKNIQQLMKIDMSQYAATMAAYHYIVDTKSATDTYKIESFQSTYTIYKSEYEITLYFSSVAGFLAPLQADMKKLYPKAKHTGEGTATEEFEYEVKEADGTHSYTLTLDIPKAGKAYVTLLRF